MYPCPEDIVLEIARIEREARRAVLTKIASRQLGEAWEGLVPVSARQAVDRHEAAPSALPDPLERVA